MESEAMKRSPTEAQKQAAVAKREKFRALAKQIADMPEEARQALAMKFAGVVTVEGRALSLTNTMLCALQFPGVTMVGGFRQWIAHGRCVRKGEHGISIWFPKATGSGQERSVEPNQDADPDGAEVRFLVGTVFDVSQTEELKEKTAAPVLELAGVES
jgi:hypothetical protein